MIKTNVIEFKNLENSSDYASDLLGELLRSGAEKLIYDAVG
jgi:hypothetical protein